MGQSPRRERESRNRNLASNLGTEITLKDGHTHREPRSPLPPSAAPRSAGLAVEEVRHDDVQVVAQQHVAVEVHAAVHRDEARLPGGEPRRALDAADARPRISDFLGGGSLEWEPLTGVSCRRCYRNRDLAFRSRHA